MSLIVKISDYLVSSLSDEMLITYSLGSCVGVTIYDPVLGIGGLLHSMLPLSKIDEVKAKQQPAMFVDTGLTAMLTEFFQQGSTRNRLVVKIAGCSQLLDEKGIFRIGERNNAVTRKILWKNNILIAGEDVGGTLSRTVMLNIGTGVTTIRSSGKEYQI